VCKHDVVYRELARRRRIF